MSVHRYSLRSLIADYARGLVGAAAGVGGFVLVPPSSAMAVVFAGLTALFLLFTIRTALRQRTYVELTDRTIASRPGQERPLAWDEIEAVKLRYYSTRRARDRGWMTLRLTSGRRRIAVDSNLEGFETVVARAAEAAGRNGLDLSETTRANFAALGFPVAADAEADEAAGNRKPGPRGEAAGG